MTQRGCPLCDWDGNVSIQHDYSHEYYTHIIVKDGEVFKGKQCSRRLKKKRGLRNRLARVIGT